MRANWQSTVNAHRRFTARKAKKLAAKKETGNKITISKRVATAVGRGKIFGHMPNEENFGNKPNRSKHGK